MTSVELLDRQFDEHPGQGTEILDAVRRHLAEPGGRLLDIGCGTGSNLVALAGIFPRATVVGVEVSSVSAALARQRVASTGLGGRVTIVEADYAATDLGRFDVITAVSVLHLMAAPDEEVLGRLGANLAPGGTVVLTIPYDCLSNRVLWGVRRLLRGFRGRALEAVALRLARRLHPGMDERFLAQRLPYMYLLPTRRDGRRMRDAAWRFGGLQVLQSTNLSRRSLASPRHRLLVLAAPPA